MNRFMALIRSQTAARARFMWKVAIWASYAVTVVRARAPMSMSHGGRLASSAAGTRFLKYLAVMARTREKRLPRSLARSALIRWTRASSENPASRPKDISRQRK